MSEAESHSQPERQARRGVKKIAALCASALLSVALFVSGLWMGSATDRDDQDVDSLARAIVAEPVTVAVESRVLENIVTVRGSIAISGARHSVPFRPNGALPIVTAAPPASGQEIVEGEAILEVAERPFIAIGGNIPAYRTLTSGSRGRDVEAVEQFLQRSGLFGGSPDLVFDSVTELAIDRLYDRLGYPTPMGGAEAVGVDGVPQVVPRVELPLSEFAIVPGQRWLVGEVAASLGAPAPEALMQLVDGVPLLVASLGEQFGSDLKPGLPARVQIAGDNREGVIVAVDRQPSQEGEPSRAEVRIAVDGLNPSAVGAEAVADIIVDQTAEAVLVAPLNAVRTDGAGQDFVAVLDGGETHPVQVDVGLVNPTHAELIPSGNSKLAEGVEVVIG